MTKTSFMATNASTWRPHRASTASLPKKAPRLTKWPFAQWMTPSCTAKSYTPLAFPKQSDVNCYVTTRWSSLRLIKATLTAAFKSYCPMTITSLKSMTRPRLLAVGKPCPNKTPKKIWPVILNRCSVPWRFVRWSSQAAKPRPIRSALKTLLVCFKRWSRNIKKAKPSQTVKQPMTWPHGYSAKLNTLMAAWMPVKKKQSCNGLKPPVKTTLAGFYPMFAVCLKG